jgi:hypothetical protein
MVAISMLLCTPKILQFEHYAWKVCQLMFLGRTGWKGEYTTSALNTTAMPLLIVYLHLDGAVRVSRELGATNNS